MNKTVNQFMASFLLKVSILFFALLHYGLSIVMLVRGTPIAEDRVEMFLVLSVIGFVTLFLFSIVPLIKSVHKQ